MRKQCKQWDTQHQHIDNLIHRLDEAYTHWDRGELSDNEFDVLLQEIQQEREKQRVQEQMIMH